MEQRMARKAPHMGLSPTPSAFVLELWIPASAGMTDYLYI
jgi:hypothetical protein